VRWARPLALILLLVVPEAAAQRQWPQRPAIIAINGQVSIERASHPGPVSAEWGERIVPVGLVQYVNKSGGSSRLAVWCEFEPGGTFKTIRLTTRP
jgi:hypothetical protein